MIGIWIPILIHIDNSHRVNTKRKKILIVIEQDYLSRIQDRVLTKLI